MAELKLPDTARRQIIAALQDENDREALELLDSFRDSWGISREREEEGGPDAILKDFRNALLEDRFEDAELLAANFDVAAALEPELFRRLFALDNAFAVQWLLRTFRPPLEQVVGTGETYGCGVAAPAKAKKGRRVQPVDPEYVVGLLGYGGRRNMAGVLARHFGVSAKAYPKDWFAVLPAALVEALSDLPPTSRSIADAESVWLTERGMRCPIGAEQR